MLLAVYYIGSTLLNKQDIGNCCPLSLGKILFEKLFISYNFRVLQNKSCIFERPATSSSPSNNDFFEDILWNFYSIMGCSLNQSLVLM